MPDQINTGNKAQGPQSAVENGRANQAPGNLSNGRAGRRRNTLVAAVCGAVLLTMTVASFAAVPLYDLFCRITGYGGTAQRAASAPVNIGVRDFIVHFDANVNNDLQWDFWPQNSHVSVRAGEPLELQYFAQNNASSVSTGMSVFNVTPHEAAVYFNKLECFCYTEQTLASGERVGMPVVFFLDPAIEMDDDLTSLKEITLSYTFMAVSPDTEGAQGAQGAQGAHAMITGAAMHAAQADVVDHSAHINNGAPGRRS